RSNFGSTSFQANFQILRAFGNRFHRLLCRTVQELPPDSRPPWFSATCQVCVFLHIHFTTVFPTMSTLGHKEARPIAFSVIILTETWPPSRASCPALARARRGEDRATTSIHERLVDQRLDILR